jgi:GTP cyclohydrolase II
VPSAGKCRCSSARFQSGSVPREYDTAPTELPRPSLRHQASQLHAHTLLIPLPTLLSCATLNCLYTSFSSMPELPSHTSPGLPPLYTPQPQSPSRSGFDFHTSDSAVGEDTTQDHGPRASQHRRSDPPPSIISPAFTPPATPGFTTPSQPRRPPRSIPVDTSRSTDSPRPELLQKLPVVECEVRARIPTTTGHEMWLHVYRNNVDTKEHLAIVFGNQIRSRSLDAERPGETELDRMTRGAYVGRLYPGRMSSRIEAIKRAEGVPSKRTPDVDTTNNLDNGLASPSSASSENGDVQTPTSDLPLVRIHSECYTGETVWSARCDCGEQLDEGARLMADPTFSPSGGAIIYLRQEGRGIGLGEKLKAYNLQDLGNDTYEANVMLRHPADARSYGLATAMLQDLGLDGERGIRLLTNNPDKVRAVEGPGREVVVRERVAMVPLAWKTGGKQGIKSEEVEKYLSTKVGTLQNPGTENADIDTDREVQAYAGPKVTTHGAIECTHKT